MLVEEDVPTTLVPLDLTLRCAVDGAWLDALAAAGPFCAVLARIIEHYRAQFGASSGRDDVPLHDSLAVLEAAVPGILRPAPLPLEVVCDHGPGRGAVLADPIPAAAGRLVDVALGTDLTERDIDAIGTSILDRLRTL